MKEFNHSDHKDRTVWLRLIGALLLFTGMGAAFLGPVELYCFYLFSEGGRFHYDGFGFGSLMFGNITCQIIGYYLIAILCIPLGYGHITIRRWARTLSIAMLWWWLVIGMPLTLVFLFVLFASKTLTPVIGWVTIGLAALTYFVMPWVMVRFYRSRDVVLTFEQKDWHTYKVEKLSMPVLVLSLLFTFYVIVLHIPILFNGVFPYFGMLGSGLKSIIILDLLIWSMVFLIGGILKQRPWAWWGAFIYLVALITSSTLTFTKIKWAALLAKMNFPPTELGILQGLPLDGWHFAIFFGLPLILTLGILIGSKRYFVKDTAITP
jgi:hypothetical protein